MTTTLKTVIITSKKGAAGKTALASIDIPVVRFPELWKTVHRAAQTFQGRQKQGNDR
jgi:hypothetical protein